MTVIYFVVVPLFASGALHFPIIGNLFTTAQTGMFYFLLIQHKLT